MSCNDDGRTNLIWKSEAMAELRSVQLIEPAAYTERDHLCTGVSPLMAWVTPFLVFLAVVSEIFVHV